MPKEGGTEEGTEAFRRGGKKGVQCRSMADRAGYIRM